MKAAPTTIRSSGVETARSGLFDRLARRAVLAMLANFRGEALMLHFPEGTKATFGRIDPHRETVSVHIHTPRFFRHILLQGEIGFGESYMRGEWSTDDLPGVIRCLIDNLEQIPGMSGSKRKSAAFHLLRAVNRFAHWSRRNTRRNSRRNIREHYDLSNDFYALWLDESLTYSSALFQGKESLQSAQENKYDRLCRKLDLKPGMRVLEIGCGWGGFSLHAARNFGVQVTAVTISDAQWQKASERVAAAGLGERVDVRLADYRELEGQYDAIVSIEMLEAVGHEFLRGYFDQCHRLLKKEGRLGLQVIVCPDCRYEQMRRSVDWIKKHIFPGGQLPSIKALLDSIHATGDLYLHHLENFGLHYARTLQLWRERFNEHRKSLTEMGFDEVFVRKWNYYLAYCEAAFASRNINVAQLVLTRPNNTAFGLERFLS
jgi:cyclopropane-fatty-acyl-phospholipid synthase